MNKTATGLRDLGRQEQSRQSNEDAIAIARMEETMHTTIIITFGLVLLAMMLFIGEKLGFSRQTLTYSFVILWLALTVINGAIGVVTAGQALSTELGIGTMVFSIPVAALVLFMVLSAES
jgi:fructose-1,6-bisphosphatase/sedoheptulose 1,7-bisphosphatase-like protein